MTTKITEKNISNLANIGVQWQSVFVGDGSTGLTAVAGRGYFINTTSGTVTVTLPASPSAGDVVVLKDYARTWGTNNVTIASTLTDGTTSENTFSTNGQTVTLVYMDGTKGWSLINEDTSSELVIPPTFIAATGGTITTSGDYKIHSFTGDGCFVVSTIGNSPTVPTGGPSVVDYLVVAGGGGGGGAHGPGGGAGGYRESSGAASGCYTVSPLGSGVCGITVTATTYPITVGAGGAAQNTTSGTTAGKGSNSVFSTITSAGGGNVGRYNQPAPAAALSKDGGSGAGVNGCGQGPLAGQGNTPPVSPPQGNPGGKGVNAPPAFAGGGGGGAGSPGHVGSPTGGAPGGCGVSSSITGSSVTRAGGGGGGVYATPSSNAGGGGPGGGGAGGGDNTPTACSGVANTGGGGGGGGAPNPAENGGAGGKGIVIIRYKYQ